MSDGHVLVPAISTRPTSTLQCHGISAFLWDDPFNLLVKLGTERLVKSCLLAAVVVIICGLIAEGIDEPTALRHLLLMDRGLSGGDEMAWCNAKKQAMNDCASSIMTAARTTGTACAISTSHSPLLRG
jgi:hypothetical protein